MFVFPLTSSDAFSHLGVLFNHNQEGIIEILGSLSQGPLMSINLRDDFMWPI